uniref:Polyprotein n=1 Tax=Oryza sativa subsp. japonica TaxID=39947 RepID=Q75H51_ORYSJ|nr:putative polyprotein [Oryza sativa Japonica Group]AAT85163.1 putative polyprotein [Oryza sativa Japonica Group]
MGFFSGIDDFAFPPGQAFQFGSLNFITNDFGKISLLDSDSNQSGRDQVPVAFGIPNSAEAYSKIISPESASNHSDEIQSTLPRPDQDDGSREVGVILQPLGTVSTEELDGYLSSPGFSSRPTEILDYDNFGYHYDHGDLDNFDDSYEDNYTPLFFNVFMADNETEEQRQAREADQDSARQEAERRRLEEERQRQERERLQPITLLDTLVKEDVLNQADHVVNILNQTKTMIAASVPANSASTHTPTGSRVPQLQSHDYHQPSLSIIGIGSSRRSRGHDERSVHSPPERHRERRVERPRSPPHQRPVDLRDTINQRRAARGHRHSPNRYDDDVDGVAAFTNDLRRVDWPAGFKPTGIEKYDGTTNPESWLTVYGLAIRAAGGDSKAMANYLPVKSGESLRDYIRRFSEQRNKISDITDDVIIAAFTKGIRHEDLVGKFRRKPPRTVKQMFEKANEYAKAEDAITASKQSGTTWKPKKDTPTVGGSGSNNHKDRKRKPKELVATTSPSSRQRSRVNTFDKIMNSQCPHHPNSNHVAKDCFVYKQFAEQYVKNARKPSDGDQGTSKKKDDEDDAPTGFPDHRKELNYIFGGTLAYESKRKQKLTEREINAVQPNTPQYLRWPEIAIKFDRSDHPDRVVHLGRYPLVLDPVVRNVKLRRTLIDGASALNILFAKTPDDMQIPRTELKPSNAPFHDVIPGLSATPVGQITLPVTFGTRENFRTENVCFEVADFETAYHAILGRPALAKFMAVPHYTYMMMKMPGPGGVISLRSDIKQAVTCDKESCEMPQTHETTLAREEIRLAATTASEGEVPATKLTKTEESDAKTKKIPLDPSDPDKTANNKDIFAWKPSDMPGIPREVIEHSLHVKEDAKPIKQRLRRFAQDRKDAIKEELTKLLAAGFIKEVLHPDWLANPVLVRKKTGQWRMCVNYTDLNKSCPKDPFGLPRIDQIGHNVEAYVDDVVVKTKQKDDLIADLEETFKSIRAFKMKLNPEKCIFGVPSGKLLGFMVSQRGIQPNPEKINAILSMKPPSSQKDVQKLTGCMVALSRFVSRLGERGMPFFKLLKKTDNFQWGPEAQKAFEDFKKLLTTPPVLASPHPQEPLLLYVTATYQVVSTVLVVERKEEGHIQKVQRPIYFVSEVLADSKTRYPQVQKKLSHYFQSNSVTVITSFPLGDILHNREANGRIAKWALELMSLDISFKPRTSIKSQALADFLAEWTECQEDMPEEKMEYWTMHFDGSKRLTGTGARVVLISPTGERLSYVLWIHFSASHNMAEYEALLHGLRIAISLGIRRLIVRGDSQLVVNQVMKEWSCLDDNMTAYRQEKSPSGILQRCVSLEEGRQLLKDIHSGICGNHATARTIVGKAYRQGFFWPTAVSDADKIVWTCEGCQFFARQTHLPAQELQTIPLSWPFAVWGLDMVGPFKRAVGGYTHLFVAIDKFSKWIEAKPVITITTDKARDFFINIVHQFGVPNRIITDNGTQFTGGAFKDFCEDFGIKICYASVAHPMSNGQVECANGMILQGIKARVFDRLRPYAGKWVDQLPSVLWSLRTTPSRATGQSPFFLVYGVEAMLPSEVEFESLRFRNFNEEGYEEGRVDGINRLEEAREAAFIQSTRYLQGLRRYHNRNVRSRAFLVGDLVLMKIQTTQDRHKLSPLWEGPFIIAEVTRPGSYRLKREDGTLINNS